MTDIAVGMACKIERRNIGGALDHAWEKLIVRMTPKRAYFNCGDWFALDDPKREIKPRYLDYRTYVVSVRTLQPSSAEKKT